MKSRRVLWASVLLLSVLTFALGVGLRAPPDVTQGEVIPQGALWPDPKPLQPFSLQDQREERFHLDHVHGRWSFLFFGYTHCPDICPITLELMSEVWQDIQRRHTDKAIQMLFVTLDPTRDTPQRLQRYLEHFNDAFIGLGGPLADVLEFAGQFSIPYAYRKVEGGEDYHVDHPGSLFLLDPSARWVGVLQPPHQPATILSDFTAISHFITARSEPDAAVPMWFSNAWVNVPPPGIGMTAAYFSIHNPSTSPRRLLAVTSRDFTAAALHESVQTEDYMVQMREVPWLSIPAQGVLSLRPGGLHLMLEGPARPIQAGDEIPIRLQFADGGHSQLSLPVRSGSGARHHGTDGHAEP